MKGICVKIIQSSSDYLGNMESCQVGETVIVGLQFKFTTGVCLCAYNVPVCVCAYEKQLHFVHTD